MRVYTRVSHLSLSFNPAEVAYVRRDQESLSALALTDFGRLL